MASVMDPMDANPNSAHCPSVLPVCTQLNDRLPSQAICSESPAPCSSSKSFAEIQCHGLVSVSKGFVTDDVAMLPSRPINDEGCGTAIGTVDASTVLNLPSPDDDEADLDSAPFLLSLVPGRAIGLSNATGRMGGSPSAHLKRMGPKTNTDSESTPISISRLTKKYGLGPIKDVGSVSASSCESSAKIYVG